MMAGVQKYFDYVMGYIRGIPPVTLLGQCSDYEQILSKLDRLERYGPEPTQFAVIKRIAASCDAPTSAEVASFW